MATVPEGPDTFFRIGPDSVKPERYALSRGQIEKRLNVEYYKGEARCVAASLRMRFPDIKPLGAYGEVVCGPFGTAIKIGDYVADGVPLLRISNLTDTGTLDNQGIAFVTHEKSDKLRSTQVTQGDVVVSQRGTLGISAVVSSEYPIYNISANLVAVRGISGVDPRFVQLYLASRLGASQIERLQSGQVHPKITTDDVASVLIPNVANQQELICRMTVARDERKSKLVAAEALLAGLDNFVLDALGIVLPLEESRRAFAVKRGKLNQRQIGPSTHAPALQHFLDGISDHPAVSQRLGAYVDVNPQVDLSGMEGQQLVGFIPMSAVSDGATGDYTFEEKRLSDVRKGYTPFVNGDILWAKITPCMQNGKSCIVEGLPNGIGFGSTEFHVLRVREQGILAGFVREFVSQRKLRQIATYAFTGSAGQQRVPVEFLASLPFPQLSEAEQREIVDSIAAVRAKAHQLRIEAETGWQAAKLQFEEQLLGQVAS